MSRIFHRFSIVLGIFLLIGIGFFAKNIAEKQMPLQTTKKPTLIDREVPVVEVVNSVYDTELEIQGSLEAYNKIDIFAEITGTLTNDNRILKDGHTIQEGEILLNIEKREAVLNVLSQKSNLLNTITIMMPKLKIDFPESFDQWEVYLNEFNVEKPIKNIPDPVTKRENFFIASKNIMQQFYNIKNAENQLNKFTVYAPFSGVITQSKIHPGMLVRAGQKIGELVGNTYELKTTFKLAHLKSIKIGTRVMLYTDVVEGKWKGKVKRISNQIDANTQSVIVYLGVKGNHLKEGMFLRGKIKLNSMKNVVKIPLELLLDHKQVFIIENGKLRLKDIELINVEADFAIIKGLPDKTLLLKETMSGAYDGLKIRPSELVVKTFY